MSETFRNQWFWTRNQDPKQEFYAKSHEAKVKQHKCVEELLHKTSQFMDSHPIFDFEFHDTIGTTPHDDILSDFWKKRLDQVVKYAIATETSYILYLPASALSERLGR